VTGRFEQWLAGGKMTGPPRAGAGAVSSADEPDTGYPGHRYGLPGHGAGAVASLGRRLLGLIADCVIAELVTSLFVRGSLQPEHVQELNYWSLLTWFLITTIGTGLFAMSPGMALVGIRVARTDGRGLLLPWRAALRAVLVALVVPAVVWDTDRRGLHDKAAGTIVVTTR
jgi:uncharacterized RDD family membrane protein YckC